MSSIGRNGKWRRALILWVVSLTLLNGIFPAGRPGTAAAAQLAEDAAQAVMQGFAIEANAANNGVKTGEQADITVKVTAGEAREAAVRLQVLGPAGNLEARQQYPKAAFEAGAVRTYRFAWNVPDAIPAGNYTVRVQVTDASGSTVYKEEARALVLEVKPSIGEPQPDGTANYTAQAVVSPYVAGTGEQLEGTAVVASSRDTTIQVKLDLYNAHGEKVHAQTYDRQAMQANKRYLFPILWQIPADAKHGRYKTVVSVSSPDGVQLYERNAATGFFVVTENAESQAGDYEPPAVPDEVKVSDAGDGFVKLSWKAVASPDAAGYNVYVTNGEAGWSRIVYAGQDNSYTVAGLANRTEYRFTVTAVDLAGNESAQSAPVSGTPVDRIPPKAPQGLAAAAGDKSVSLSWTPNTEKDLAGYKLFISADGGTTWDAGVHVGLEAAYTVTQLENGKAYTFALIAFDTSENSSPKSETVSAVPVDRTAPEAPAEAAAEAQDGAVLVRWSAVSAEDLEGYTLYVSEDGGAAWQPGISAGTSLERLVEGLTNDKEYTFAVAASDKAGNESVKSVYVKATPVDMTAPMAPTGLAAEAGDAQVKLRWTAADADQGVTGYHVYVSKDGGETWLAPVNAGEAPEYVVTNLSNDTTYAFAVAAFDARGNESAKSAVVTAKPMPSDIDRTPPSVPEIMMGIPESNGAVLVWSEVPEADLAGYKIYKSTDGGLTWDAGMPVGNITMYFNQGLKGGVPYTFAIAAIDASGNESAKSQPKTVTPVAGPDRTPPAVPTGVSAVAGSKTAAVTWNAVSDEDLQNYYVYITNNQTGSYMRYYAGNVTQYNAAGLLNGVEYTIQVSAVDISGNESARSAGVKVTPSSTDTIPPAVPTALQITDVRDGMLSLRWNESPDADKDHYNVYISADNGATWRPAQTARTAAFLASGLTNGTLYTFAVTTVDIHDNESGKSSTVSGTPSKYIVPQGLTASSGDGEVKLGWNAVTASDLKEYRVYTSLDGGATWNTGASAGMTARYTAKPLVNGRLYTFAVTAVRTDGAESVKSAAVSAKPDQLIIPPDPGSIAPALPETGNVAFKDMVSFLYTGETPVQFGVTPGVLREEQMSVLTGRVHDTEGNPIPGVKITVLNNSDLGMTATRADGAYDIVVNGGKGVTLQYEKAGYMTVQRKAPADWNTFFTMPEVVLTEYDAQVTEVRLAGATDVQVAQGSPVTDEDGTRQASVLFNPGTTATIKLPDGTVRTLDTLHVRATEYTVGGKGEEAMPGEIPQGVAYTYAVELSADEAVAAGADRVEFNRPVYVYVDNFLDLRVGSIVPNGYYNLKQGAWEAEKDGVVVKIVSETGGVAQIDMNGDGAAETDAYLADFGWTAGERAKLASMYEAGKTLWRVPVSHFSPYDWNQNAIVRPDQRLLPPEGSVRNPGDDTGDGQSDPCNDSGSIIGCYYQTLGQSIPITGTPLTLDFHSDMTPGYKIRSEIEVPLTDGRSLPSELMMATVTVTVAGKTMQKTYTVSSLAPNQTAKFSWDGLDRYGRKLIGEHPYTAIVKYHYPSTMYIGTLPASSGGGGSGGGSGGSGSSFGGVAAVFAAAGYFTQGRDSAELNRAYRGYFDSPQNPYEETGIAGWKLSSQDLLMNLDTGYVFEEMNGRNQGVTIPANSRNITGPDGSFYVKKGTDLYRIMPDGKGAEKADTLRSAQDELIAYGADGTMYAKDATTQNVYRKRAGESAWTHFAGNGTPLPVGSHPYYPDGTQAASVSWSIQYRDYEVGPEGKLYFIDDGILYRIDANGVMFNYAVADKTIRDDNYLGTGVAEGEATKANIGRVDAVEIGKDGTIYVLQSHAINPCKIGCESRGIMVSQIKAIYPTGEVRSVAGVPFAKDFESEVQGTQYNAADGVKASDAVFYALSFELDEEGNLYFEHYTGSSPNRTAYKIDTEGFIHEFDRRAIEKIKLLAAKEAEWNPESVIYRLVQAGPGDRVYFTAQVRDNQEMVFYMGRGKGGTSDTLTVPEDSGVYAGVYSLENGRLLRTVSTLTGKTHYTYEYDAEGRLIAIRDFKGDTVTIQRDGSGVPTAIVSPYGQVTTLKVENGRLTEVTNPAGETYSIAYDDLGLMTQFTNPENQVKHYGYDGKGLLIRAETAREGVKTLERTENETGHEVKITDPDGNVMIYTVRDQTGLKSLSMKDAAGAEVTVNRFASMTTKRYPDGSVDSLTFAQDPQFGEPYVSQMRKLTYDKQEVNRSVLREVTLADEYDPFSIVSMKTTFTLEGAVSTSEYFPAERKVVLRTAEGRQTVYYMDEWDRTVKVEEPGTAIAPVVYLYDERGRLKRIEQGAQYLEYTYNDRGLVEATANSAGHVKRYQYDAANRLIGSFTPGGKQYRYGYDKMGNQTSLVMPNGETISQGFNADGDFESLRFGEEAESLLVGRTLGGDKDLSRMWSGKLIDYTSEGDKLTAINDNDLLRSFTYAPDDKLGRLQSIKSVTTSVYADEQLVVLGYNGPNIVATDFSGDAQGKFRYTNNKFGMLTSVESSVTSSVYGTLTRSDAVAYNSDFDVTQFGPFTYSYNGPNKRLDGIQDGQMKLSRSYDELGRLSGVSYTIGGKEAYRVSYTYNLRNFPETKTVVSNGTTEHFAYTYDGDDQLIDVIRTAEGSPAMAEHYEYDVNKNRVVRDVYGFAREAGVYGAFDQLTKSGETEYAFDADGYLTRRGSDTFRYGPRGELLEANAGGKSIHYTYDGLGRLVAREDAQGKTQYLYGNRYRPKSVSASIGPDGVITFYHYDLNGYLLGLERDGQRYYVVTDQVGTPVQVLNAAGETVKSAKYDSFGVLLDDSNPAFKLAIGFAGGLADEDTKLLRFGSRDYDPMSARWTARDPIFFDSGQANMYVYVNNNPVVANDPCGQGCIGGSLYDGVGGGGKICWGNEGEGIAFCGEVGLGFGGGLDVSPGEGLPSTYHAFEIGVKVKAGALAVSGGYEWKREFGTPCSKLKWNRSPKLSAGFGPFEADLLSPNESKLTGMRDELNLTPGEIVDKQYDEFMAKDADWKTKIEGTAKFKACRSFKF